jgi:DNA-binding NtrC family response regulator
MRWSFRGINWTRLLLGAAGVMVCLYSAAVLWAALVLPDIGLRTTFDPTVNRVVPRYLRTDGEHFTTPEPGDVITRLHDRQVIIWPQLLRGLIDLEKESATPVTGLAQADRTALTYVSLNGERLVRVEFERPWSSESFACWFEIDQLPAEEILPSVLWFVLSLGLFLVGALVFWKRPKDESAARFFLLCIVTLGAYMGGYHWSHLISRPALLLVFIVCGVLLPAVLLQFCLTFPQPRGLVQRYPRWIWLSIYGVPLTSTTVLSVAYLRVVWLFRGGAPAADVEQAMMLLRYLTYGQFGCAGLWYFASVLVLVQGWWTAKDHTKRGQAGCILAGALAALGLIAYTLVLAVRDRREFAAGGATWPMFFASLSFTLAFVVSMTRYRLMQLDQLTFYREKYQLDRTLQRMGQAVGQLVDPPTLARRMLQASAELLGVSQGAVYLRDGNPPSYRLAGHLGTAPELTELPPGCPLVEALKTRGAVTAEADDIPAARQLRFLRGEVSQVLAHEGQVLALLVLGAKESGPYGSDDLNLLSAFAQMTALALENAEGHRTIELLNRDLQAKVEKISEQQRRILALQSQLAEQASVRDATATAAPNNDSQTNGTAAQAGFVGSSPTVQNLLRLVKKVADSESAVLIRGESGTGKELLATALHDHSARAGKAFIKVHCAALSSGLLESELFGHVKGGYTGALSDRVGRFEQAHGGTLLLDEIGDISLEVQTKLLRVLQEKTVERVGSNHPIQVDVRIISATHQNLETMIHQGRFREDLYYRLNVISVQVPSLRDRREDIPELVQYFLKKYGTKGGLPLPQLDDDALLALKAYPWPGNVRQLESVVQRAVAVADGTLITINDLPREIRSEATPLAPVTPAGWLSDLADRDRQERDLLVRALTAASGNKAEAARALGLARSTLVSRLKKHGLS